MAATLIPGNSSLKVSIHIGDTEGGSPIYKNLTFGSVKAAATAQDVYDVAMVIGNLQEYDVSGILLQENSSIINA